MSIECSMDPAVCEALIRQQKELVVTYVTYTVYVVSGVVFGLVGYDVYQSKQKQEVDG